MSKLLVFPGQGSQFVGMGEGLFEKFGDIVAIADKVLGYSIVELCLKDPHKRLNQTQYTQPALYTVSVLHYLDAVARQEAEPGAADNHVDYLAGHSLGEYAALFAAGAFDFETGLKIVNKRGELMAVAPKGAMAAVLNLDLNRVSEILAQSSFDKVELANINSDNQIVLSGDHDQIIGAEQLFSDYGARYVRLNVSAGFHSSLMNDVAEQFYRYLEQFDFKPLEREVISNVTARPYPRENYVELLKTQIDHPVKWYESVSWALAQGVEEIEELGPGMVLQKMARVIRENPMSLVTPDSDPQAVKTVFMFAGQGSQFKNMGRELYLENAQFKAHLDHCDEIVRAVTGQSLVAQLYHPRADAVFSDVRSTHVALLCFQYALAQMLIDNGVTPDEVIGHSLGEYVALVIAQSLTLEQAIQLTAAQAQLLSTKTAAGAMMAVIAKPQLFDEQPSWFEGLHFAAKNYRDSFVVSGVSADIERCAQQLKIQQVNHQILPVDIAFHSPLIDAAKQDFIALADEVELADSTIVFHPSAGEMADKGRGGNYLWHCISARSDFVESLKRVGTQGRMFIDLSPAASLSGFVQYDLGSGGYTALLSRFGRDSQSVAEALSVLRRSH